MAKRTPSKASGTRSRSSKGQSRARTRRSSEPPIVISPEHQRDLFALALITLAAITLIFFYTGSTGGLGAAWMLVVSQAFGAGALWVPLTLGLLGVLILIQERFVDAKVTGSNILGILLILGAILCLFEFQIERPGPRELPGQGGGVVGYLLLRLFFERAIGAPAAFLVVCVLGLAGVLLTFNLTLRELIGGVSYQFGQFWNVIWAPERRAPPPALPAPGTAERSATAYVPPPGADDDQVLTPIAERPTRASLFRRGGEAATEPAPSPKAAVPAETPAPAAAKVEPVAKPAPTIHPAQPPAPEVARPDGPAAAEPAVQEALDGFEVSPIQRAWPLPLLDLLETYPEGSVAPEELQRKARIIEDTLASFKVEVQVKDIHIGPAVTQFELLPAVGVKVSKITTLERDLALALAAPSIRIEAPIPGKAAVGIEIPNSAISVVSMRDVMDSDEFGNAKGRLKLPLGMAIAGVPVVADMAAMPHLLVAGSTGSGKSVAVNCFISALLLKHTPDELKFIMVDPKMVELIVYNRIPHLLSPVVTELERVVPTLKWATREMERRYKIFARHGFRNLDSYKQAARRRADLEPMPYIIIIIDELADLMMMAPDEVETLICRLAQMARATGIHLIIATQRPSVDVVTGLIKANFPSRIAFQVTSQTDSRVILDMNGAEQLLGRGDMLYMARDAGKPVRVQGTYVSDGEVERIVSFWQKAIVTTQVRDQGSGGTDSRAQSAAGGADTTKHAAPSPDGKQAAVVGNASAASSASAADPEMAFQAPAEFLSVDEQDALLPQAIDLVRGHRRASASLLQRRLRIGYSKAAQLIDLLEQQGIVGPAEGGRSREVLDGREL